MCVRRSDRQKWGLKEVQFPFHGHASVKPLLSEPGTVLFTPTTAQNTSHTLKHTLSEELNYLSKVSRAISPRGVLLKPVVFHLIPIVFSVCPIVLFDYFGYVWSCDENVFQLHSDKNIVLLKPVEVGVYTVYLFHTNILLCQITL